MDQHVSEEILRWEHSVYDMYYRSRKLRRLLKKQVVNKGVARCHDGVLRYTVRGSRMSGDMNTALGNCLVMCALVYALRQELGIRLELANNGDDCVIILERRHLQAFQEAVVGHFTALGFPLKVEDPVFEFEKVSFCQTQPVYDGTRWTMCRDPRVCLDKDACSLKPIQSAKAYDTLRNTVGLGGLALAGHMPVFCEFYEALRRGAGDRVDKDMTPSGFKMLAKGMNMKGVSVTAEARASFFNAFDITPDEQLALESHFKNVLPTWRDPVLEGMSVSKGELGALAGLVC
jgi:hypothetical protein